MGEKGAAEATRVGAYGNVQSLGNGSKGLNQVELGFEGRSLVAEPVATGGLKAVLRSGVRGRKDPRFGVSRAVKGAVHLASLGGGPIAVDTQIIEIRLALIPNGQIGGVKFKPGRGGGTDGDGPGEDPAISAGGSNFQGGGAGSSDAPIHGLGAKCHAGAGSPDDDVGGSGVLGIHEEGGACPKIETFLSVCSVAAIPVDAPLERD